MAWTVKITELPAKATPVWTDLVQTVDTANNKSTLTEVFAQAKTLNSDLVDKTSVDVMTNKDLTDWSNTFPTLNQDTTWNSASTDALKSATTTIDVASATAPTVWQVLKATSSTAATWQTATVASATETSEWVVERSTDAEATAWTDTTRYVSPKQVKDNYAMIVDTTLFTRSVATASWTQVVSHSLWIVPKKINFAMVADNNFFSNWTYISGWNQCVFFGTTSSSKSSDCIAFDAAGTSYIWRVTAATSTNFTVTWTRTWTPSGTMYINASLIW